MAAFLAWQGKQYSNWLAILIKKVSADTKQRQLILRGPQVKGYIDICNSAL